MINNLINLENINKLCYINPTNCYFQPYLLPYIMQNKGEVCVTDVFLIWQKYYWLKI